MTPPKKKAGIDDVLQATGGGVHDLHRLPGVEVNGSDLPLGLQPEHLTEQGVALAFIAQYGDDLLYVEQLGTWFVWDGTQWVHTGSGRRGPRGPASTAAIRDGFRNAPDPLGVPPRRSVPDLPRPGCSAACLSGQASTAGWLLGHGARQSPLLIPEVETLDVHLERFPAPGQGDALDHPLILGDDPVAAVTHLPVAGTAPHSGNAVVGQCPIAQLLANHELETVLVHG
jgi:hypothetical protein